MTLSPKRENKINAVLCVAPSTHSLRLSIEHSYGNLLLLRMTVLTGQWWCTI